MRVATGFMQYRGGELAADRIIHTIGNFAGVVGRSCWRASPRVLPNGRFSWQASSIPLAFSRCSAALQPTISPPIPSGREFLRQLDHAAIFLMIAGTYTPFTTCRLHGVWAIGMTAAVWTGAITGAAIKLICPRGIKPGSIVAYLALGWMILLGMRPMRLAR